MLKLLPLILVLICFPAVGGATIHGTIYQWDTLEPLGDVIVTVDTLPPQTYVSKAGDYSFELPQGTFNLKAGYYQGNVLELSSEENITIDKEGEFVLDIIMLPSLEDDFLFDDLDLSIIPEGDRSGNGPGPGRFDNTILFLGAFVGVLLIVAAFFYFKNLNSNKSLGKEEDVPDSPDFPEDLALVMEILTQNDGRMTQLDLRKRLGFSEAKVSLMVSDLEERGLVKRIKKGRGNIIILK